MSFTALGRLFARLALCAAVMCPAALVAGPDPQVEAVQRRLVELGYEPGTVDGLMGPRTRTALAALQRDRALAATGHVDADTLAALGLRGAPEAQGGSGEAPARALSRSSSIIRYEYLGWHGPMSAQSVLSRLHASRDAPLRERIDEVLIVPNPERIYILERGERLEGLPCDPAAGAIRAELMLSPGGPVLFTPLGEQGLCQLGLGIVLGVGSVLTMEEARWAELSFPAGRVRLGPEGLRYER